MVKFTIPETDLDDIEWDTDLTKYISPFVDVEESSIRKDALLVEYKALLVLDQKRLCKQNICDDVILELNNKVEAQEARDFSAADPLTRAELVWKGPSYSVGAIVEEFLRKQVVDHMNKDFKLYNEALKQLQEHFGKSLEKITPAEIQDFEFKGKTKAQTNVLNNISFLQPSPQRIMFHPNEVMIMCAVCRDVPSDREPPYVCCLRNAKTSMAKHLNMVHGVSKTEYELTKKDTTDFGSKFPILFLGMFYYGN